MKNEELRKLLTDYEIICDEKYKLHTIVREISDKNISAITFETKNGHILTYQMQESLRRDLEPVFSLQYGIANSNYEFITREIEKLKAEEA